MYIFVKFGESWMESKAPENAPTQQDSSSEVWRRLIAVEDELADPDFIDKLIAAHAVKDVIQSAGHQIDRDLLADLNALFFAFEIDVQARLRVFGFWPREEEAVKISTHVDK